MQPASSKWTVQKQKKRKYPRGKLVVMPEGLAKRFELEECKALKGGG